METYIPIDIDKLQRVLLTDGWHQVRDGSFLVGPYGFVRGQTVIVNGRVPGVAREGTGLSRARHIDLDVPKFAGAGAME